MRGPRLPPGRACPPPDRPDPLRARLVPEDIEHRAPTAVLEKVWCTMARRMPPRTVALFSVGIMTSTVGDSGGKSIRWLGSRVSSSFSLEKMCRSAQDFVHEPGQRARPDGDEDRHGAPLVRLVGCSRRGPYFKARAIVSALYSIAPTYVFVGDCALSVSVYRSPTKLAPVSAASCAIVRSLNPASPNTDLTRCSLTVFSSSAYSRADGSESGLALTIAR